MSNYIKALFVLLFQILKVFVCLLQKIHLRHTRIKECSSPHTTRIMLSQTSTNVLYIFTTPGG